MKNPIKEKYHQNAKTIGTFFESGSESIAECLGLTALDYFIIDAEHGPFDPQSACGFIRCTQGKNIAALVRVSEISRSAVLKMLDIGAAGLIIPCVNSIDEVQNLIQWSKYSPLGKRGFFMARPAGYGFDPIAKDLDTYFSAMNDHALLIPQCETIGCLNQIEKIAALEGVDGIFVGPYDLSIALGIPGELSHPLFLEAIHRILKTCKSAKKMSIIYGNTPEDAQRWLDLGFDSVTISMDIAFLMKSYKSMISQLKY